MHLGMHLPRDSMLLSVHSHWAQARLGMHSLEDRVLLGNASRDEPSARGLGRGVHCAPCACLLHHGNA